MEQRSKRRKLEGAFVLAIDSFGVAVGGDLEGDVHAVSTAANSGRVREVAALAILGAGEAVHITGSAKPTYFIEADRTFNFGSSRYTGYGNPIDIRRVGDRGNNSNDIGPPGLGRKNGTSGHDADQNNNEKQADDFFHDFIPPVKTNKAVFIRIFFIRFTGKKVS